MEPRLARLERRAVEGEKTAICWKKISVLPRGTTFFVRLLEKGSYIFLRSFGMKNVQVYDPPMV